MTVDEPQQLEAVSDMVEATAVDVESASVPATSVTGATSSTTTMIPLSKNQQKKLRRKLEWEQGRADRILKRKEKRVEYKARKRERVASGELPPRASKRKLEARQEQATGSIAIDLSFDHLMKDSEISSMVKQITRCYHANRTATRPFHYHACVGTPADQSRILQQMQALGQHAAWKNFQMHQQTMEQVFDREQLVYLCAESETVLHELDDKDVYVLGGLVDRNRHKGLCHKKATELGLRTARLPIDEYVTNMPTRRVLTVNHVYEILCAWRQNGGDWKKAFYAVLPERKFRDGNAVAQTDGADGEAVEEEEVLVEAEDVDDSVPDEAAFKKDVEKSTVDPGVVLNAE